MYSGGQSFFNVIPGQEPIIFFIVLVALSDYKHGIFRPRYFENRPLSNARVYFMLLR